MIFCGHCGYQLQAGSTMCPRCGAPTGSATTPELDAEERLDADQPTVASHYWTQQAVSPTIEDGGNAPQQPLILRAPDGGYRQEQGANEATRMVNAPMQMGAAPFRSQEMTTSYPGIASQPGFGTQMPPFYGVPPETAARHRNRGRIIALLLILLGLLLVIGAMALYLFSNRGAAKTPSQLAQAAVQQFYDDINARNYQGAYNLLGSSFQHGQPYNNFANGYARTRHDALTFNSITPQSDGTVKVDVTIIATEDAASGGGTQQSTYQGSYIVGQENGTWKILSGQLNKM